MRVLSDEVLNRKELHSARKSKSQRPRLLIKPMVVLKCFIKIVLFLGL